MVRRVSDEGIQLIKQWEGLRLFAYDDKGVPYNAIKPGDEVIGVLTIGYGHTGPDVYPGQVITEARADELLRYDVRTAEQAVARLIDVPLTDAQHAALVSFTYNVGQGALEKSTLRRRLNAGDYDAVPEQLMRWVHDNGVRVEGLVNRRAAEVGLWSRKSYVASRHIKPSPPAEIANTATVSGGAATIGGGAVAVTGVASTLEDASNHLASGNTIMIVAGVVLLIVGGIALYRMWRNAGSPVPWR